MQAKRIPPNPDVLCECGCGQRSAANVRLPGHELRRSVLDKIAEYYVVDVASGCWIWQRTSNIHGYGMVRAGGHGRHAHCVFYEYFVGQIPSGLHVDHLCRNRLCVNPAHLEPVEPAENNRRGKSPAAVHARQTHCKRGHPLSGDNLMIRPNGRQCYACHRLRGRQAYARARAKARTQGPHGRPA